ncbi:MAG: methionyl-tRNA formyltransferase [Patescibacteria group bacterium]
MRVVFLGTPAFGRTILERVLEAGWEVPLAISQPSRTVQRRGRSSEPVPSPVTTAAREHGVDIEEPDRLDAVLPDLRELSPDAFVVASFGRLVPRELLELPAPWVNVHASLLPRYRGASPIQQAIIDGQAGTGVSLMRMTEGLDEGPVYAVRPVSIAGDDTAGSLSEKLADAGAGLLVKTLPGIVRGSLEPKPQPEDGVSYTTRLTKASGTIDWSQGAETLERFVRAMQPWPGARTAADEATVTITAASVAMAARDPEAPGTFGAQPPLIVSAGNGRLRVDRLTPAGKPEMPGDDWLRGRRRGGRFD